MAIGSIESGECGVAGNRHISWIHRLLIGIDVVAGCSLHPAIECIGNAAGGKRRGVRNRTRTLTSENCLIRNHRASGRCLESNSKAVLRHVLFTHVTGSVSIIINMVGLHRGTAASRADLPVLCGAGCICVSRENVGRITCLVRAT